MWMRLASLRSCYSPAATDTIKSFSEIRGLHPLIVEKLTQQKLLETTNIQGKCLPDLLSDESRTKSCVINAETGSGKTLCFLLPILQLMTQQSMEKGSSTVRMPLSLVFVPTSHLAHQIADVFRSLALPEWGSSLSYGGNKLTLKSNSHLVIATPSSLSNFSLSRLLRNVKILCVDEADVLLTGGEKQMTWNILEEMRRLYHNDVKSLHNPAPVVAREVSSSTASDETECSRQSCETASIHRQIIFTAATLPSRGRKSVQGQLLRWVPKDTLFFDTDQTHQVIPLAQLRFVDIRANEGLQNDGLNTRFEQLVEDLLSLRGNLCTADGSHQEEQDGDLPKVLLFANTVSSAEEIFSHLEKFAAERADIWWGGKLGRLHKMSNVDPEEKERTLHDFRAGNCRVLVSTDLASRGLDLPNVTAVIQVDFPGNSADFLHRAGRTARAGKSGTVISYVGEMDRDLATKVREVIEDRSKSFNLIFSRNKMLRRRINRKKVAANSQ